VPKKVKQLLINVFNKKLRRLLVIPFFSNSPKFLIGMQPLNNVVGMAECIAWFVCSISCLFFGFSLLKIIILFQTNYINVMFFFKHKQH